MDILASLKIRRVSGSELPQRLLLAADESREAVADYVDRGWCYGAFLAGAEGFRKLEIGTGNSGFGQMALYARCGFRMEWIDRGFFTLHYPNPILEEGMPCTDMVRMGMLL